MKANSDKSKQSNKATRRVLAGVLCGASVLSLVLSLVMPPISQAIANDAQTVSTEKTVMGGGSSSESTDVGNTNNGDTENQTSGAIEDGEADPSNGIEQGQSENQPEGELQVEDGGSLDGNAVMLAAEDGQTETASGEINNVSDLKTKLENASGVASFKLMNDVETSETITLNQDGSNITLDLNGHKIKHKNQYLPLFNITGGATLTVKDKEPTNDQPIGSPQTLSDQGQTLTAENYGKKAQLAYDSNSIPTSLTYYVTESRANGTGTTETLKAYTADIKGAIVACGGENANGLKLVNLFNGGHFNLESGTLTQKQGEHVGNLVYAENGSTVTVDGGYICGADTGDSGAGAGIEVSNTKGKRSTLKVTGGVISGNSASSGAGVFAADYVNASAVNQDNDSTRGKPTVEMTGGIITGNYTRDSVVGLGGGIMVSGGSITVSGGFITNNKYAKFCDADGNGDHGGAGLAANNGAHVTISGGQITGNYSKEAGGGVYVTDVDRRGGSRSDMAWLSITGGIIASNVSFRSEGAGIRVGQMVDAMINGTTSSKVYITNNHCMSRFDWGGGGIFVQGSTQNASNAGRLFVYNSYISSNTAGGYGGGVAVCPSGKTLVTGTEGTAIFGNTDAGDASGYDNTNNKYNPSDNTGNNASPHLSGGGDGKDQDYVAYAYNPPVFRNNGHADFFLAAHDHNEPIAAVIGKMLGGGDAKYSGSIELEKEIRIPANGGVQVKNSIGLSSGVKTGDPAADAAQNAATTFITGNYSWDHGGGIMSNGDLYLGVPADTYVYPSLKLKASKELNGRDLKDGEFSFTVYRKGSDDPFANGTFNRDACTKVGTANNDAYGNITFNLGEQFAASGTADTITYYLAENAGKVSDITYDPAVYEIKVTVKNNTTVLMHVPTRVDPNKTTELKIHNYEIENVTAVEHPKGETYSQNVVVKRDTTEGYYSIVGPGEGKTFTNVYTSYDSNGSWVPKATKVVKGGEMKEFTLEFADNESFTGDSVKTVSTTAGGRNPQTKDFPAITYTLDSLKKNDTDVPGRGASKTFRYFVREKTDGSLFLHYKYDKSVYRFDVTMTDQKDGTIKATTVTYTKIKDAGGNPIDDQEPIVFDSNNPNEHGPTFTNTYSTSLPLSGMSGVTLTYLAGAAVLCAAAAWMHIRRKASAKGGERRE